MPLLLLIILSVLAYANAWPDVLVFDDKALLAGGSLSLLQYSDIVNFFTEDLWHGIGGRSGIYRPLFLTWMTLESKLFGSWYAGHHLVNIALHALVTALVYLLIRRLMTLRDMANETAQLAAVLGAAVFAVHPIHAEVVNSVFNRSEILVSILLVGGLSWFLQARLKTEWLAWFGLSAIYFIALLFRESAASLPALAVACVFLLSRDSFPVRLRQCLPVLLMILPLGVYLYLRKQAMAVEWSPLMSAAATTGDAVGASVPNPEILVRFEPDNIFRATRFWMDSLKLLLWPHPLFLYYEKSLVNFWLAAAVQLALLSFACWRYFAKEKVGLLIGLAFFYIAILPSSRLIADAGSPPDLADRYLYLPSVGLSITLAFGLAILLSGAVPRLNNNRGRRLATGTVLAICLVLTPLTWARNADWSNELVLFEKDYSRQERPRRILYTLLGVHLQERNFQRAAELCRKHRDVVRRTEATIMRCASAYIGLGQYDAAERAYLEMLDVADNWRTRAWAHFQLGSFSARMGRRDEANDHFSQAVTHERLEFMNEFYLGSQLLLLYPNHPARKQEARAHLERSLELQPRFRPAREALEHLD